MVTQLTGLAKVVLHLVRVAGCGPSYSAVLEVTHIPRATGLGIPSHSAWYPHETEIQAFYSTTHQLWHLRQVT